MRHCWIPIVTLAAALLFEGRMHQAAADTPSGKPPTKTPQAWTLDEGMRALAADPGDVYLQYVALQLARAEGRVDEVVDSIQSMDRGWGRPPEREVDLFALFTGALAVQESLQLDTMRTETSELPRHIGERRHETVKITDLKGPQVRSHPWGKMLAAQTLAGKRPEVSPLAMCVPEDQYFVLFHSVRRLLETSDLSDLWGAHLFSQTVRSARTQQTGEGIRTQLAVQVDPLTRPFYDMVVDEVAITGSDLYLTEGSDVTLLFEIKQPDLFKIRMDGFLAAAEKSRPDAVRSAGRILDIPYVHVGTPDRAVYVFSAYPGPNLHVRSNSEVAFRRVLETIVGQTVDGRPGIGALGNSTEFKYIRTLMPRGAAEEDGFIYLSDPLIRRLVGPELKLTEYRRRLAYNHLRMIGHASMYFHTQYGRKPRSLEELASSGCAPGVFGEGKLRCPAGGEYGLSADGTTGFNSHYGHARQLVPCREIPVTRVTEAEAEQYNEFLDRYNRYWVRFFDPIAIRIQITPDKYRAETIILPLIDNSIYSRMAMTLGGEPEPLDALPVPDRNIFSTVVRINKEPISAAGRGVVLLDDLLDWPGSLPREAKPDAELVLAFLNRGIGNQVGMHVYDASPMVDFNLTGFLGEMIGRFHGGSDFLDDDVLYISFLVSSLNAPVYLAVPVEDPQVVDEFLDQLDVTLAYAARQLSRRGFFELDFDFYRVPLADDDSRVRCYSLRLGPVKWRVFFARIDDGLYLASKRFILDDLMAAHAARSATVADGTPLDPGPTAHAMVRIRPKHWREVLPAFQLGWAETARESCLTNLGPLSSVARSLVASRDGELTAEQVLREAEVLYGAHFFCPDGGRYVLSPDGRGVTCSVHGSVRSPRQGSVPSPKGAMGRLMKEFSGLTAELTFLEDGLHAVVTLDRK